jgi:acyl-CoA dehydrogenase
MTRTANMTLNFSDEQAMILESAKAFCADKSPITVVRSLLDSDRGYLPEVWDEMVALGWTGISIPEQYGGSDLGVGSIIPLIESMGRHLHCAPLISTSLAAQAILRGGSEQQKQTWLPKIVEGAIGTLALLDNSDWGASLSACTLETSDQKLRLSGRKLLVSDASVADFFVVSANHQGKACLVIVDAAQLAPESLHRKTLIDETKRACDIDFSGVEVDASALLPNGEAALRDIRLLGALFSAAEATGSCAATLDCIVDYLTTRIQFGKLIGSYQALKHPTVDILLQMEASRSLLYQAASIVSAASVDTDVEIACRMAKAQATEALLFAGDRAVQFHGGMGFTYDCDAQLYLRRGQWQQHQYGDAQHHRRHLAALLLD